MGVNMAGNCISDDDACRQAACQEIIRRYYRALVTEKREVIAPVQSQRIALLMAKVGVSKEDRPVVPPRWRWLRPPASRPRRSSCPTGAS